MADIGVERKRRLGWWPWLVGLAVVALAIWLFTRLAGDEGEEAAESFDRPAQSAPASP